MAIKLLPLLESPWSAVSVGNALLPRVTPSSADVPSSDASGTLCQPTHVKYFCLQDNFKYHDSSHLFSL